MGFLTDLNKLSILRNGNNFLNSGEYGLAKLQYKRYLEMYGYEEGVVERKAMCHMQLREYKEAITCYNQILRHVKDKYALNNKGHAYNELRQPSNALKALEKCTQIFPDFADGWSNKGRSLAALGRYSESLECYQKALEISPYHNEAKIGYEFLINKKNEYNNKAIDLDEKGKYEEALKYYDKAIEIYPEDPILYYNKGVALQNKNDIPGAIRLFEKALEYDFYNYNVRSSLSILYNIKGNEAHNAGLYDDAIIYYDKSLEMDDEDSTVLCNKGSSLYQKNEKEESLTYFKKALIFDEKNETALDYMEKLKKEGFYVELNDEKEYSEEFYINDHDEEKSIDELERWFSLYEKGAITLEEYEYAKNNILRNKNFYYDENNDNDKEVKEEQDNFINSFCTNCGAKYESVLEPPSKCYFCGCEISIDNEFAVMSDKSLHGLHLSEDISLEDLEYVRNEFENIKSSMSAEEFINEFNKIKEDFKDKDFFNDKDFVDMLVNSAEPPVYQNSIMDNKKSSKKTLELSEKLQNSIEKIK